MENMSGVANNGTWLCCDGWGMLNGCRHPIICVHGVMDALGEERRTGHCGKCGAYMVESCFPEGVKPYPLGGLCAEGMEGGAA